MIFFRKIKAKFKKIGFSFIKGFFTSTVLASLVFSLVLPAMLYPLPAQAVMVVTDPGVEAVSAQGNVLTKALDSLRDARDTAKDSLKDAVFLALNQSLNYMLNTFAYDAATYLASGGKGQKPMFFEEGWGDYLKNLADSAAGQFIETVGEDFLNVNVCNPSNASLKISIGLGLSDIRRPRRPTCSVSDMINNWDRLVNDPNFLNRFNVIFDPEQNDIGIAFSIFNKYYEKTAEVTAAGERDREEGEGFIAKVSGIAGKILTPSQLVKGLGERLTSAEIDASKEKVQYGPIVLNAVDTFTTTLIGKLFQRLFKEGLSGGGSSSSEPGSSSLGFLRGLNLFGNSNQGLYSFEDTSSAGAAGRQFSEVRFLDFLQSGTGQVEPYDILSKLTVCSDPEDPGPEDCVITPEFRIAVDRGLTVAEAINFGFIDGAAPFGFFDYDADAIYRGIPYRSIVILRSHRIVPVGWELAAEAINKFEPEKVYSLNDLIRLFEDEESRYKGLIDPNWVLVVPQHLCRAEGYGPKILFEDVVGGVDANADGDFNDPDDTQPQRLVGRAQYCADFQTCINKADDGTCLNYGYCAEERRIWDLQGASCPEEYNTCQTFQDPQGQLVSYLKNSLDYNGCSIDNAGCQWYCQEYNTVNNVWTCVNEGERALRPCNSANGCALATACSMSEGETFCSDNISGVNLTISDECNPGSRYWTGSNCLVNVSCTIPFGGVSCQVTGCENLPNLLNNPDFEIGPAFTGNLAAGWDGAFDNSSSYFSLVSGAGEKVHPESGGTRSLRFFSAGGNIGSPAIVTSAEFSLPAGEHNFSGNVYNQLNAGRIRLFVTGNVLDNQGNSVAQVESSIKNDWQSLSRDFTVVDSGGGSGAVQIRIVVSGQTSGGGLVSGAAWFDRFRISQSCVVNPVELALVGTIEADESKLHLDRDVQSCPADADGCSELILTGPNTGTNLLANSSFENWPNPNDIPPGWNKGGSWVAAQQPQPRVQRADDSPIDRFSLRLTNGESGYPRDLESEIIRSIKPNTAYRVSFWAKTGPGQEISPNEQLWYTEIQSGAFDYQHLITAGDRFLRLTDQWQRLVMDTITTTNSGDNFKLGILNSSSDAIKDLYIDGIQIEEVVLNNAIVSSYKDYGQINSVYLKKPPEYLNCRGFTADRPSPNALAGVSQSQCGGETLIWLADGCHEIDAGECDNYAFYCQQDEVGCEAYTPLAGGMSIPGVVSAGDYCPLECVGYEAYKESSTFFEKQESLEYFIPRSAVSCNAAQAGCDEFTNLDEVAAGGEGREYYQALRLCEKPDDPGASCSNFYNWQGSDETGFQLKVYNLSAEGNEPALAIDTSNIAQWPEQWCGNKTLDGDGNPLCCNGAEDIGTNPFCREILSGDGSVSYQILENTISCSNDCHPFRKTRLGEGDAEAQVNCEASHGQWEGGACVYQAIPNQGAACSAQAAGCREYKGNAGANVFRAFSDNFEDGDVFGWHFGDISSEALSVAGHSIKSESLNDNTKRLVTTWAVLGGVVGQAPICGDALPACDENDTYDCYNQNRQRCVARDNVNSETCLVNVGETGCSLINEATEPGRTYLLSFWAKADSDLADIDVEFFSELATQSIGEVSLGADWNYYTLGPFVYGSEVGITSRLRLLTSEAGAPDFYVDNIELKEVVSHIYAIKNSWNTPASCDINPYVSPLAEAPQFMLGCEQYRDSIGQIHNLKSFDHLCREQAVGCEAMIDTYNSTSPFEESFNFGDAVSEVRVPADEVVYITNRAEFSCTSGFKGCQGLGLPAVNISDEVVSYQTSYLINNPDQYNQILCQSGEVGCEEYQSDNGFSYFKDPREKTCEYRQIGATGQFGWFITSSGSATPDCPVVRAPIGEIHPGSGFAGFCPAEYNSCEQFIDPSSTIAKNVLFNGDFDQTEEGSTLPEGWSRDAGTDYIWQDVLLKENTVYTLGFTSGEKPAVSDRGRLWFGLKECPGVVSFDHSITQSQSGICAGEDNCFILPQEFYVSDNRGSTTGGLSENWSEISYSGRFMVPAPRGPLSGDQTCRLGIAYTTSPAPADPSFLSAIFSKNNGLVEEVFVRETEISQVLANTVDKVSCNGLVDPEKGCVLFNDRSGVNYTLGENDTSYLRFDADVSGRNINNGLPVFECFGNCDSNAVLKVRPDRTCESWLYCSSFATVVDNNGVERNYCSSLGLCDSLDENGVCDGVVATREGEERQDFYGDREAIKNLSGYSNPGFSFSAGEEVDGYFPYAEMSQEGGSSRIANGNFEFSFGDSAEPIGWIPVDYDRSDNDSYAPIEWFNHKFKIERDFNISPEGSGYLRLNTFYEAVSEEIDVEPNFEYVLTGKINTQFLDQSGNQALSAILIQPIDSFGGSISSGFNDCILQAGTLDGDWYLCRNLDVAAGLPWQDVSYRFNSGSASKLKIKLSNIGANDPGCTGVGRYNLDQGCGLSGYGLFDNISLKAVLGVNSEDGQNNFISRSCRLYPTADALSCDFQRDESFFFGKQGFCVTADPADPKKCVQWWPVDQILGETLDEVVAGYSDRAPLYYCIGSDALLFEVAESDVTFNIASDHRQYVGNSLLTNDGTGVNFEPFDLDDDYQALFRAPYIKSFDFSAFGLGVGGDLDGIGFTIPLSTTLEWKNGRWEDYGAVILVVPVSEGLYVGFFVPVGWEAAASAELQTLRDSYESVIADLISGDKYGTVFVGPTIGMRVVTDQDTEFASAATDPIPDVDGDILGIAWFMNFSSAEISTTLNARVKGQFNVNYCQELVRVVTSAGSNKAYAGRLSPGSGFVLRDDASVFNDSADYKYREPFDYRDFVNAAIDGEPYQSSDYLPFGSLVQPADSQYPTAWDSKSGSLYRQPLLYEPPRPSFGPPHQARMGELHKAEKIQQLFARSYGVWEWEWDQDRCSGGSKHNQTCSEDSDCPVTFIEGLANGVRQVLGFPPTEHQCIPATGEGGGYTLADPLNNWDLISQDEYCTGDTRPDDQLCKIRPKITNIAVNGQLSEDIIGSGTARLSFNITVDPDQAPITAYTIVWGDGTADTISGVILRSRVNPENPFIVNHLYDYGQMYRSDNQDGVLQNCDENQCTAKVTISTTDNWGASNSATMTGTITVFRD